MFHATVHDFGELAIVRCAGRLLHGEASAILGNAMSFRTRKRVIVLEMSDVDGIDAGGVGLLASITRWASGHGIRLKLMHPAAIVHEMLALTGLLSSFELFTCEELADLFGLGSRRDESTRVGCLTQ